MHDGRSEYSACYYRMDISDSYSYCKESRVTAMMLHGEVELPNLPSVRNGLILELLSIKGCEESASWSDFKRWIQDMTRNYDPVSDSAIQWSVTNLLSQKRKLQKNMHRARDGDTKLTLFLEEPYKLPRQVHRPKASVELHHKVPPTQSAFIKETIITVNQSLGKELNQLYELCRMGAKTSRAKEREIEVLKQKLREVNPRNVRRQIKRKNAKITHHTATIKHLKYEIKSSKQNLIKKLRDQVRYYKTKCIMDHDQPAECDECKRLETIVEQEKMEKAELLHTNSEYRDTIKELRSKNGKLTFYQEGKYTDDLRMCIMELLSCNVGILNVEPIIKSVLTLAGLQYDKLPKHTAVNEMLIEGRCIAKKQVAETLSQAPYSTLHSDGTSKFGHKFIGYQVSTTEGSLSIGMQVSQTCETLILLFEYVLLMSFLGSSIWSCRMHTPDSKRHSTRIIRIKSDTKYQQYCRKDH